MLPVVQSEGMLNPVSPGFIFGVFVVLSHCES